MAFAPDDKPGAAWLELGTYGRSAPDPHGATVDFTFGASYRVLSHLTLRALYPLMYGTGSANFGPVSYSESALDSGNPYLGAEWGIATEHLRMRFGGGATIPLAPLDTMHAIDGLTEAAAAALHGAVDTWLYLANTFAVVGRAHFETRRPLLGYFVLAADMAIAPLIPTGNTTGRHVQLILQWQFSAGVQIIREVSAGLRFSVVDDPTDGGYLGLGDPAQSSLSIYGRVELGTAFFDAMLTMNLDSEFGFAFDTARYWGVRVAGGARF